MTHLHTSGGSVVALAGSKLRPPLPTDFALDRSALVDRIAEAATGPLTLITAQAGAGKSVALSQWAARSDVPVGWLTLDRLDSDAMSFGRSLVSALATIDPDIGRVALERIDTTGVNLGDAFIDSLLDDLAYAPELALVFDGLDALSNEALIEEFSEFVARTGTHVHSVAATRARIAMPLDGFDPHDVSTFSTADLALDVNELRQLVLRVAGHSLDDHHAGLLLARTEGWAAGVQLAALSLRWSDDPERFIDRFSGNDEFVGSYLTNEVMRHLPKSSRRFLMQTSVLDMLHPQLCDAITERHDSIEVLASLERQSLFTRRVSPAGDWFSYHPLFKDLIRHQLRVLEPGAEGLLLHRAAEWLLEHGGAEDAARYLIEAGDGQAVLDVISQYGKAMFEAGRTTTVLQWLETVPPPARIGQPATDIRALVLYTMAGRTRQAEAVALDLEARSGLTVAEQVLIDGARATWADFHCPPDVSISAANRVLQALPNVDGSDLPDIFGLSEKESIEAVARITRARFRWLLGETTWPRSELAELLETTSYLPWMVNVLGDMALIEAWSGNLAFADALARRALEATRKLGTRHQATEYARLALVSVLRERNLLARADVLLAGNVFKRSTSVAMAAAERAMLHLASGQPERGLEELSRYETSGHPPPPGRIGNRMLAVKIELLLATGAVGRAGALPAAALPVQSSDLSAAVAHAFFQVGDLASTRATLEDWPALDGPRSYLQRELWTSLVESGEGNQRAAGRRFAQVVTDAEPGGFVRLFADAGAGVRRAVRPLAKIRPSPYVMEILDATQARGSGSVSAAEDLAAPLSGRELAVLKFLPTSQSNREIADQLYVSVNTVKSHVRSIYRKLGVKERHEAVEKAARLNLA